MPEHERGFSLVEVVVTVGILSILLAAGGVWMLGMHPGALAQATDDYDAAMASARGLAAAGGNGATLAFLPRVLGGRVVPGFQLRVYAGRPSATGAVSPTNAMPLVSDAAVSEATYGAPPFAIFIGTSGHVSGRAAYPIVDALGNATFPAISAEPACPANGVVLTFVSPQGARQQRMLPCIASLAGAAGPPNPSPTPNVPIVTPTGVIFHWPADAQQTVVATEWGYTHWFAATGFACGGVATFPNDLPNPYASPYDTAEGLATPLPPAGKPFSYPNSGGQSMEDAPAPFPLDPKTEGLCSATVHDEYAQKATASVQVMGWLTATYGGVAYTHVSSSQLSLPSSAFPSKGASVKLAVTKAYDSEALQVLVSLDQACSPYVTATAVAGSTPAAPSITPARATLTLHLVNMPKSPISCGGVIYDQYAGSRVGEGVPFNATIDADGPLVAWPSGLRIAASSASPLGTVQSGFAGSGKACLAIAYSDASMTTPDANDTTQVDAAGNLLVQTDAAGCILSPAGEPMPGAAVATQKGFTSGDFQERAGSCAGLVSVGSAWAPNSLGAGPGGERIATSPIATTPPDSPCALEIVGDPATPATPAPIAAEVLGSCGLIPCFLEITGQWDSYVSCGHVQDCDVVNTADLIYESPDHGFSWELWQDRIPNAVDCPIDPIKSGFTYDSFSGPLLSAPNSYAVTWSPPSGAPPGLTGLPTASVPHCSLGPKPP